MDDAKRGSGEVSSVQGLLHTSAFRKQKEKTIDCRGLGASKHVTFSKARNTQIGPQEHCTGSAEPSHETLAGHKVART